MAKEIITNWTERVRKQCLYDLICYLNIYLKVPWYGSPCNIVPQTLYYILFIQAAHVRTSGQSLGTLK
jgi:hypothetical protein